MPDEVTLRHVRRLQARGPRRKEGALGSFPSFADQPQLHPKQEAATHRRPLLVYTTTHSVLQLLHNTSTNPNSSCSFRLAQPLPSSNPSVSSQTTHNQYTMSAATVARSAMRAAAPASSILRTSCRTRTFATTRRLMETPTGALPVRKPVGAFRGG